MTHGIHEYIFMLCYSLSFIYQIHNNGQMQTTLCFSVIIKNQKALTLFIMKILCDLVKGCTYRELMFVDAEMSLIPVTWARWIRLPIFWASKDIICNRRWQ